MKINLGFLERKDLMRTDLNDVELSLCGVCGMLWVPRMNLFSELDIEDRLQWKRHQMIFAMQVGKP